MPDSSLLHICTMSDQAVHAGGKDCGHKKKFIFTFTVITFAIAQGESRSIFRLQISLDG